jgi:hypothetical protein
VFVEKIDVLPAFIEKIGFQSLARIAVQASRVTGNKYMGVLVTESPEEILQMMGATLAGHFISAE